MLLHRAATCAPRVLLGARALSVAASRTEATMNELYMRAVEPKPPAECVAGRGCSALLRTRSPQAC
jgi:hypothetical protein